jgi:hypothetical protein
MYFILLFCFAGALRNLRSLLTSGFDYASAYSEVLVAMLVMYMAQVLLIFIRESKVWIISAIQAFFCFYVYPDFTFLPAIAILQNIIWHYAHGVSYGWMLFISLSSISALFSLEVLKTYFIYVLTQEKVNRRL